MTWFHFLRSLVEKPASGAVPPKIARSERGRSTEESRTSNGLAPSQTAAQSKTVSWDPGSNGSTAATLSISRDVASTNSAQGLDGQDLKSSTSLTVSDVSRK